MLNRWKVERRCAIALASFLWKHNQTADAIARAMKGFGK